ncbi:MAG: hypothetical protein ACI9V8_000360 [Urechidicola sp.]|jgi:hypothetical protein
MVRIHASVICHITPREDGSKSFPMRLKAYNLTFREGNTLKEAGLDTKASVEISSETT